ncbi:Na+/H+ antiporter [Bradyrhizobium diazoefficiens]|jgi:Na+/H+ antiporter|nr:Na+/H+ antiporter [Bradyrhizobium diazoefficiens]UCF51198.1 MAG: Na+/H+ antiporter [Bradyrhizobium sp.]MBR0966433.1 Na+/H+ antiporter [Bradyrhizobium diazoefficiens]MBR0980049.1 Na+/H+ antiporter [Bradyrhizobium diazoefficiens]MBR1009397.1 Na+/H+ antiporter [Bradyrhizobium diazoefficiens]MBR1015980.1 Na+/H+ antiporter [Bradyrhizobium diazoefficiens]
MEAKFQIFLILLAVLAGTALAARRFNVAPAILLMLAGVGLAFVPGMPPVELPPQLVLLMVLPPLIYSASVAMSWREFRKNLRPIVLLAVGCVIFTAAMVAAATHYLLGLPWTIGFLLGAIVAPPDVVAPLAIARRLHLPHRIMVVLEGEGLANDATALILYRFALAAIMVGHFSLPMAAGEFSLIVAGEIAFGIGVGWLSLRARKWSRDPQVELTLSLITPYVSYWVPEHVGGSGVIATVACGLYVSWNGPLLISSATRLQGIFFWDLVIYMIEGLLFLLTGFQLRALYEKSKAFPLDDIMIATALVVVIIVIARFAWLFPATYLPRILSRSLRERDPSPPWQWAFILAFTGVRGAVSLATALALPFTLPGGEAFPFRDLILFVAFGVIFITLIGVGLTLPPVVRWLGVAEAGRNEHVAEHEAEIAARRQALDAALRSLDAMKEEKDLSDEVVRLLHARHEIRISQLPDSLDPSNHDVSAAGTTLTRELIVAERKFIHDLLRDGQITDETRRRIERDLDLEEASLANREYRGTPL